MLVIVMNRYERDYIKDYEDFWKDIVENEDGTLNKDQVMRELSDFSMVIDNCSKAYSRMTHQNISTPTTIFFEVEGLFEYYFIDKGYVKDDMVEILKNDNIEELKNSIKEYFEISDSNE